VKRWVEPGTLPCNFFEPELGEAFHELQEHHLETGDGVRWRGAFLDGVDRPTQILDRVEELADDFTTTKLLFDDRLALEPRADFRNFGGLLLVCRADRTEAGVEGLNFIPEHIDGVGLDQAELDHLSVDHLVVSASFGGGRWRAVGNGGWDFGANGGRVVGAGLRVSGHRIPRSVGREGNHARPPVNHSLARHARRGTRPARSPPLAGAPVQDRQTRILIVLASLLLALVSLLVLVEPPAEKPDDDAPVFERVFVDLDPELVDGLDIVSPGGTVALARIEGGWRLTSPVQAEADASAVDRMVSTLVQVEAQPALDGVDDQTFGLDQTKVVLHLRDGGERSMRVGRDAPVGSQTYIDAGLGVQVSRSRLSSTVGRGADDLRSKALVRFEDQDVDRVVVGGPSQLLLERDEHGWWTTLPDGARIRASEGAALELIGGLSEARATTFLSPEDWPSDQAATTIDVRAQGAVHHIELLASPPLTLVRAPLQQGPVGVEGDLFGTLQRPLTEWLFEGLLPVRPVEVDRIELRLGEDHVDSKRNQENWEPATGELVLRIVDTLEVDRSVAAPAPEGAPWGFLALHEGAVRVERVSLYQAVPGGRVGVDAAGGPPFVVGDAAMSSLRRALAADAAPLGDMPPGPLPGLGG
jgi:Domain of unknown function (DUF4340)